MAKVGRKANHYETSSGDIVQGLIRQKDGRWRILATGKRFTAETEAEAVGRFYRMAGQNPTIAIPVSIISMDALISEEPHRAKDALAASINTEFDEAGNVRFIQRVDENAMIEWARAYIVGDQFNAARRMRLPGLARIELHTPPAGAITLKELGDLYYTKSDSKQNTRGHVRSAIAKLEAITGANSLPELTTPLLMKFRDDITTQLNPTGATAIFGKVRSALSFARKVGLDAEQIDAALGRMKVLYAPKVVVEHKPTPISRGDFHRLLIMADDQWRAILLISLNLALYLEDCADLQWKDIDLDAGTFIGLRGKTKIRRVGMLWPETAAALRALPRTDSPYVFVSRTGTRYRSDSLHRRYAIIRDKAGVTAVFSSIRDGAYTIAARSCDDRTARMFAAHAAPGLMDAYVSRNPQLTKPASDAVYSAFGPFPTT